MGLEPTTLGLTSRCSNQLSYARIYTLMQTNQNSYARIYGGHYTRFAEFSK